MKKWMLAGVLAAAAASTGVAAEEECSITFRPSNDDIRYIVKKNGFDIPNYDAVCKSLEKEKIGLYIEGMQSVL